MFCGKITQTGGFMHFSPLYHMIVTFKNCDVNVFLSEFWTQGRDHGEF